jgi:hypothetical protein
VLDIIWKNIFFGFLEFFILFTNFAISNCDLVFFFHACWFFGAQFGFFFSSLSFPFVNLIPYKCYFFLQTIYNQKFELHKSYIYCFLNLIYK